MRCFSAAMGFLLIFCAGTDAQTLTTVRVGYTPAIDFSTFLIAKDKGLFAKHGMQIDPVQIPINPNIPAALLSNSIQVGTATTPTFIQAVAAGIDVVAIAGIVVSDKNKQGVAFLARTGSNVTKLEDLIGKKVGVPGIGAMLDVVGRDVLTRKGIDIRKITFVEVPLPQLGDALKVGTVDAIVNGEPFTSRIVKAGIGTVLQPLFAEWPNGIPTALYTTAGLWARENPKVVKGFQEGIAEAVKLYGNDLDIIRGSFSKYVQVPPDVLAATELPSFDRKLDPNALAYFVEVMKRQGLVRGEVDLNRAVLQ